MKKKDFIGMQLISFPAVVGLTACSDDGGNSVKSNPNPNDRLRFTGLISK